MHGYSIKVSTVSEFVAQISRQGLSKTSGGCGLPIHVPLGVGSTFERVP